LEKQTFIKQLKPYLYLLNDDGSMGYLLIGDAKAVLIDTMNGSNNLNEIVSGLTDKPVMVVNTHGHPDHIFGNVYFDEAYINDKDIELAREFIGSESFKRDFADKGLSMPPFKSISEGDVIDLGGKTLKVYELPGHTKGSIVLLFVEDRVLFVGDVINHHLWMQVPGTPMIKDAIANYDRLLFLENEADYILHGHGDGFEDIALFRSVRNGLQEIADGKTQNDLEYKWFGGIDLQHTYSAIPGKQYLQEDNVICYRKDQI